MRSRSSKTDAPAPELPEHVTVGRIVRAHGVRGEVVVEVLTQHPGRFVPGAELEAVNESGRRRGVRVERALAAPKGTRVHFAGVDDRDAAEALRGMRLEVARSLVPPAPAGSHYYFELVGCRCVDAGGSELGTVDDVVESGGGLLLQVDRGEGRRLLIPYVESFLAAVDIESRRIVCRLPEGFVASCEFKS